MAFKVHPDDFDSVLPKLDVFPHLVTVYNGVKQFSSGAIDECSLELYGFPQEEPVLWLALKTHRYSTTQLLMQASTENKDIIAKGVRAILEAIRDRIQDLDILLFVASDAITEIVNSEFEEAGTHPFMSQREPYSMFYMTPQQCERVLSEEVTLPSGFVFEDLDAERDGDVVIAAMIYAKDGDGDLNQAKSRIRSMPSVAVRHLESDRIVSFEYNSGYGQITNLYTHPEFRGLGIGSAVERKLCQRVLRELEITPVKQVSRNKPRVIEMSKKSPYWTVYQDSDGSDHLGYYTVLRKQPAEFFTMYEN